MSQKIDPASLPNSEWLSISEFARRYGRPRMTVQDWCLRGSLPGAESVMKAKNRTWRIPAGLVQTFTPPPNPQKVRGNRTDTKLTERGLEMRCTACGDFHPANAEFFQPMKKRGYIALRSRCRLCDYKRVGEWRQRNPYQWKLGIAREDRGSEGTLVLITTRRGRIYAALYPPGADTTDEAIKRQIKERRFGRSGAVLFRRYDHESGEYWSPSRRERSTYSKSNQIALALSAFGGGKKQMTATEFGKAIGRSQQTVIDWCKLGLLPAEQVFMPVLMRNIWAIPADLVETFKSFSRERPKREIRESFSRERPKREIGESVSRERPSKREIRETEIGTEMRCRECREFWPLDFFGYQSLVCKGCRHEYHIEYNARWRAAHPKPRKFPLTIARHQKCDRVLVVVQAYGHTYAAPYPLDADTSDAVILRHLKERPRGVGRGFFRRYDPVKGRFLTRRDYPSYQASLLTSEERAERRQAVQRNHSWRGHRRPEGPPPPPDYFPQRWRSPRMQKLAADIHARAQARAKAKHRKDGDQ